MFFGGRLTSADEVNYGTQGLLAPLNPLIEANAPNLQKLLREQPAIAQSITTPDGNIYALPGITAGFGLYPKLWLNKVWLEALGMDEPKTTDELYDVLEAFKTQDPTATAKPTRSRSPRRASRTGRSTISGPDFSRPSVSASVTAKPSSTSRATPCGSSPARKAFGATSPL